MKRKNCPCAVSANQRGVVTALAAISMTSLLGFTALVVDVGHMIYNQKRLDAATAAAALAGGQDLWGQTWATASATASSYTGGKGKYNALPDDITVQAPTITGLKLTSVALPSANAVSGFNAIKVQQTATVPMIFGRILGINSVTISSTSTASAGGGVAQPLNVEIILDTTQSMNSNDPSCGNITKLKCAINGAKSLVSQLSAAGDNVGLVIFPPVASQASATKDASCNSSGVTLQNYMAGTGTGINLAYDTTTSISTIVALTNSKSYLTNGNPNTVSPLMNALGVGPTGCTGLSAPGGKGTYFAQAIYQAQKNLAALSAINKQQNVMIVLSDGDAGSSNINGTAYDSNQCQQAIVAANTAKTAKTWVYVIAYQATTSGGCSTDTSSTLSPLVNGKNIQACATLKWISGTTASNTAPGASSYFYSDNSACTSPNSMASVSSLFKSISSTLMGSRLIPNNAT